MDILADRTGSKNVAKEAYYGISNIRKTNKAVNRGF
jgi:aspartate ammonia-lyase